MESDQILGSEEDVARFVKNACESCSCSLIHKKQGWLLPTIPAFLQPVLGDKPRLITFTTPALEGVEYVGRNHPLVEGLACHILEEALINTKEPIAARCVLTTTDTMTKRTTLLLLRLRHLLNGSRRNADKSPAASLLAEECLAEECVVVGFTGPPSNLSWLALEEAKALLEQANPVCDAPAGMKKQEIEELLHRVDELTVDLEQFAKERSDSLSQSHRFVRAITWEGQFKQLPMDLLGVYILQPGKRKSG
jgi:hypothetical protein